jgi:hypothetical protein
MRHVPIRIARILVLAVIAAGSRCPVLPAADDSAPVVAVIACDGYAVVKKQLGWVGQQVGNPTLAGFAESFLLIATQGKGLAGLDTGRPLGIVVTAQEEMPAVHGFVPVKDLDKLLTSLQGVIGPADKQDGVRRIAMPGGAALEIIEKDGWAVVSQEGAESVNADPGALIDPLVKAYSMAVQLFPSRMPDPMRAQLQALLEQAQEAAAAQGQPVDGDTMEAALAALAETETIVLGLGVDAGKEQVFVELRNVMTPNAKGMAAWAALGEAPPGAGLPATADGKPAAIRAHHVQPVPASARASIKEALASALPDDDDDPTMQALAGVFRDLASAMIDAGGISAGLTLDTSVATAKQPLPALTAFLRIKDGAALEKKLKERLGQDDALPPNVTAKFDARKVGQANLHEIAIGIKGLPAAEALGDAVTVTLAVAPERAFVLLGGDVPKRLAAALDSVTKSDPAAQPITGVTLSLAGLLQYAALTADAFDPGNPQNEQMTRVAAEAAEKPGTLVQLLVRPIERGVSMRLSADAGALQAAAAVVAAGQNGGARAGNVREFELPPGAGLPALAP